MSIAITTTTRALITAVMGSIIALSAAQSASAATLTVRISTTEAGQGTMFVAAYTGKDNWMKQTVQKSKAKVNGDSVEVNFEGLPDGEYALAIFQDLNDNGKMDTNMLGMPLEPYGFSNNAVGMMGPASYDKSMFVVKGDTVHQIKLSK